MSTAKMSQVASILVLFFLSLPYFATSESNSSILNRENPTLHVDFDACVSYFGGYNADYSEFTAESFANPECSSIQLVGGSVYRLVPDVNTHSCTPGFDSLAMCIGGMDSCDFLEDSDKALRFDVLVVPGPEGIGSIKEISFQAQAPENFVFFDGESGPNNYPTQYGLRVVANGTEVYRSTGLPTTQTWSEQVFDFSNLAGFMVDIPTLFNFEILPYCLVGIDSDVQAWDIDELRITGGCNDVNGGLIEAESSTTICYPDLAGSGTEISFTLEMNRGNSSAWLVTDPFGVILAIEDDNIYDFNQRDNGVYNVYHLSYDSLDFSGLELNMSINQFTGCFDLSNSVTVFNNKLVAGELSINSDTLVLICDETTGSNVLQLEIVNSVSLGTRFLLVDETGLILETTETQSIDMSPYSEGAYTIIAAHHNSMLFNAVAGMNISNLMGCFILSNAVNIEKAVIDAATISINGGDSYTACESNGFLLEPELTGSVGAESRWVAYNNNGLIVSIEEDLPIDISMFLFPELNIVHISFLGSIEGLELGEQLNELSGCYELSNSISISLPEVDGGIVSINGLDSLSICLNEADEAMLSLDLETEEGDSSAVIITDESGLIIGLPTSNELDFSGAGSGLCLVWNISWNGSLTGLELDANVAEIEGCFDISNSVSVNRIEITPAVLAANGGMTEFEFCSGDDQDDILFPEISSGSGPFSSFVITDENGSILEFTDSSSINFEGVPNGICLVYHMYANTDSIFDSEGTHIDSLGACYEISNPLTVQRNEVFGGNAMTSDSITEVFIVIGDAGADTLDLVLENALGEEMSWIITDSLGQILDVTSSSQIDFSNADAGVCFVYNISLFNPVDGLEAGVSIDSLDGCFDLSNAITVNRTVLNGGIISFSNGMDTMDICTGDAMIDSLDINLSDNEGPLFSWVLTDTSGLILELPDMLPFVFNDTPGGTCFIYHLAYTPGLSGLGEGMNLDSLNGEFNLSNTLVLNRSEVDGGEIMTSDSTVFVSLCSGDGLSDLISVNNSGAIGDSIQYLITNDSDIILVVSLGSEFDFEGIPPGVCRIYSLSYNGSIENLVVGASLDSLLGCFDLSNAITVERLAAEAGIISEASGQDTISIVVGEGITDSLEFSAIDAFGDSLLWLITDDMGSILEYGDTPPADFEGAGEGTCVVYHLAYSGEISGLSAGESVDSLSGCFDLSNSIVVERSSVDGGQIMTTDSLDFVDLCIVDAESDSIAVQLEGEQGTEFYWVITDSSGIILELAAGPDFDFSGAGTGICLIWHLASIGDLDGLAVGENVDTLSGIFDFSNAITIDRTEVDGGMISHASMSDTINFITNDNLPDSLDLELTSAIGSVNQWILTDTDGIILALPDSLPMDFEGTDAGVCLLWNISYDEEPSSLEIDSSAFELTGCFDLSNAFTIVREHINGGTIATPNEMPSLEFCLSDDIPDTLEVSLAGASASNFAWLITDSAGVILDLPLSPPFAFSNAGPGICQIWHLAYEDNLTGLDLGNNVSDFTGSYSLSNSIEVIRKETIGGILTLLNGMTIDTINVGEGIVDTIELILNGNQGEEMLFLITDTDGIILDTTSNNIMDLESAGGGLCLIWNISFSSGTEGIEIGANANDISGCFELSNPVSIQRMGLMGGTLTSIDGLTEIQLCLNDSLNASFDVILTDTLGPDFSWVITDTSGLILDLPSAPPFDGNSLAPGTCMLWHLSHEPGLPGLAIGNNVGSLMGNFNFSNSILILKSNNEAASIETTDGLTVVDIVVQEGINDTIELVVTGGSGENSAFIITDRLSNIIGINELSNSFDFENSSSGTCFIWHINYADGLEGLLLGENLSDIEGCFELSNAITVNKTAITIEGGVLSTTAFQTQLEICVGSGPVDPIELILNLNEGPNFQWVITDNNGIILGLPTATPIDLSLAGPGICNIWNLSYSAVTGLAVGENINDIAGFFDFSNPVVVTRTQADGGNIETINGLTEITVPVGEGVTDLLNVVLSGNDGEFQSWLRTDMDGDILDFDLVPPFNFESLGGGTCLIWSLSYSGELTGLDTGNNVSALMGCFDLSNSITVIKDGLNGGVLSTIDGMTTVDYCQASTSVDSIELILSDTIGSQHQLVVVSTSFEILDLPLNMPLSLDLIEEGSCLIYNIAYDTIPDGLIEGESLELLEGIYHLSNPIVVNKMEVAGGTLQFIDGSILDSITVGEGIIDTVEVMLSGNTGSFSQWVVTDTFGVVIDLPMSDPFDFEELGGGVCHIWHLAYESGLTGLSLGNNVSVLSGCYEFSNAITLVKDGLNGGLLSFDDMTTERTICFGDGEADVTEFIRQGTQGDNQDIIFTRTDGQLFVLGAPNPFDFEMIPVNIDSFIIYNIAFDTLPGNYNQGNFLGNLTGSFDLSNPVYLIRDIEKSGSITDQNGLTESTVITGDGEPDTLTMSVTGAFADSLIWVITDSLGIITEFADTNVFIYDSPENDLCSIYHIGFNPDGISGLEIGESIDSLAGCYSLSNAYTLTKKALNGGVLTTDEGLVQIDICVGDGVPDIITVETTGALGTESIYLVVNENGLILLNQNSNILDMSTIQPGECQIFHVSHDGSLSGVSNGVNISNLTGCFDFSSPVDLTKNGVFGGNLQFQGGGNTREVCSTDANPDNLVWQTSSVTGNYFYAITDTFGVIDTIIMPNVYDFSGIPEGVCRIYGVSYVGTIIAEVGDTIGLDPLVADCFDISNDFLIVNKIDCTSPLQGNTIDFSVHPNPSLGQLKIRIESLRDVNRSEWALFDISGNLIRKQKIAEGQSEFEVFELSPGMYHLRVISGGFVESKKVIVVK